MNFGFVSLGDLTSDPVSGTRPTAKQRLDEIVAAAELTEALGLESFGLGEHHSSRWVLTSPPTVLGAIAARTERIRLRTAVTLIANLDPVRAAEDYATVDLLSGGRLELTVARGNFPQPWSLFGQDVEERRERLVEGVDLLLEIWANDPVNWSGRFRPPLVDASVAPRPLQSPPPVWCGVSSTPASVEFAAARGLPIVVAGVFRDLEHCGSLIDHYRERGAAAGHPPESLRVGYVSHLHLGRDGEQARRDFEPYYRNALVSAVAEMRERMPPFDYEERLRGPLICGTPDEAVEKILGFHERFDHDLHLFHADLGGLPFSELAATMELFATEVAPVVDAELQVRAGLSPEGSARHDRGVGLTA
jgi:alkanesulfonate monooxygenase SsuD/methylene tetrahydromethanopterin reductase-like flavin-dependent oxidoreductase (luciferase family)